MQQHEEYEEEEEGEEIDLDSIEDEQTLIQMLDDTEDIDERKRIRDRLRKVQFVIKAQREKDRKRREDEREQKIRDRLKEADLRKQKTLQMYSDMAKAKTKPPGGDPSEQVEAKKRDLVEETIRDRVKRADDRKRRIMAAFDDAASSQPAGRARIVEFDTFAKADLSKLETPKPVAKGSCCFGMSGGVPQVEKVSVQPTRPAPRDDSHLDPKERAIRERVREADERKRKILAAYDMAAKASSGGKSVIIQEFTNLDIDKDTKKAPKYDPCFRGVKV